MSTAWPFRLPSMKMARKELFFVSSKISYFSTSTDGQIAFWFDETRRGGKFFFHFILFDSIFLFFLSNVPLRTDSSSPFSRSFSRNKGSMTLNESESNDKKDNENKQTNKNTIQFFCRLNNSFKRANLLWKLHNSEIGGNKNKTNKIYSIDWMLITTLMTTTIVLMMIAMMMMMMMMTMMMMTRVGAEWANHRGGRKGRKEERKQKKERKKERTTTKKVRERPYCRIGICQVLPSFR